MFISFFGTSHEPIIGADYSSDKDCIHSEDIEFNQNTQIPVLVKKKGKYYIALEDMTLPQETTEEKKKRILSILISSEEYASVDTEGISIEYADIGPAIIARFFKGDPNAEMAFLQKWNFLTSIQEKTPEQEAEIKMIKAGYVAKEEFKDFLLSLINK